MVGKLLKKGAEPLTRWLLPPLEEYWAAMQEIGFREKYIMMPPKLVKRIRMCVGPPLAEIAATAKARLAAPAPSQQADESLHAEEAARRMGISESQFYVLPPLERIPVCPQRTPQPGRFRSRAAALYRQFHESNSVDR